MTFIFKPAAREGVGLFIGVAGPSGSGKTFSALRLAKGIAGATGRIAAIDTEARRMSHYDKQFKFDVADMAPPFRPERFADAAKDAEKAGYSVLVIDSFSLEWAGEGGVLDWHDEIKGNDEKKNMSAWIKPKMAHKAMIASFMQRRIPIVFCMRAEDKVGVGAGGKPVSLGWTPIGDPRFMYELTAFLTLSNETPGLVSYKLPHKVQEQHRHLFPEMQQITETAGEQLRAWAAGADLLDGSRGGGASGGWPSFANLREFATWSAETFLPTATPDTARAWEAQFRSYLGKLINGAPQAQKTGADLMATYAQIIAPPEIDDGFGGAPADQPPAQAAA